MRNWITIILLFLLLQGCSKPILIDTFSNSDDDYFYYGNRLNRNFYYDLSISDSLTLEFESDTKGGFSSVAFLATSGLYIAGDNAGQIYSFADTSGKQKGILKHKGEIAITPIIIKSHLIYVVNEYKEKYATIYFYNYITGQYANEQPVDGNFSNEAVLYNDEILFVTQNGVVLCFNSKGDLVWQKDTDLQIFSDPVLYNDLLIFSSVSGEIVFFNVTKKSIQKLLPLSNSFESSPLVYNSVLYIGDTFGELFAVDLQSDETLWSAQLNNKIMSEPVIDKNGNLFCNTLSGYVYKIDCKNGRIIWQQKAGSVFNTSPLVFNNLILQSDLNKRMIILNKSEGLLLRTLEYERRVQTAPMFHKGYIYLGIDRGTIFRYKAEIL